MKTIAIDAQKSEELSDWIESIHSDIPSQSDFRFLEAVTGQGSVVLPEVSDYAKTHPADSFLIDGLPRFSQVGKTKLLGLLVTDAVGKPVAYGDFKASILTDIRPNLASKEANAQPERLGMHNDFPYVSDRSRPSYIVLTAHTAEGVVPKTLIAPASELIAALPSEVADTLRKPNYTATMGHKLAWPKVRRFNFPLITKGEFGDRVLFHFESINTNSSIPPEEYTEAEAARQRFSEAADQIGLESGHGIRQGQIVVVANDYALHGREKMNVEESNRLVFRSYAMYTGVRESWESELIRLDDE